MKRPRRAGGLRRFLVTLGVGGVIGAAICYNIMRRDDPSIPVVAVEQPREPVPASPAPKPADEDAIARLLRKWNLTPEELKRDLAQAGKIVREKGREFGAQMADATSDVAVIARIKTKYAFDDHLQALKITVGCKDGHVSLSGTVAAPELIGRAIVLALNTEDVTDVVSSLKVERHPEPV